MSRRPEIAELTAVKKPAFETGKIYTWDATQKFVLTGQEIDVLNKCLATQTQDGVSDWQKFLWIQRGLETINNILKEAYEEGIIVEQKPKQMTVAPSETATEEAKTE